MTIIGNDSIFGNKKIIDMGPDDFPDGTYKIYFGGRRNSKVRRPNTPFESR